MTGKTLGAHPAKARRRAAGTARKGLTVASLVTGLASVILGFTVLVPLIGLGLGVFGFRREPAHRAMALTGIILNGLTGLVWAVVLGFMFGARPGEANPGLPFAGDGTVHGILMGSGIGAALVFYAREKRRRGLTDARLWVVAGFAVAFGGIGSRLFTWDFTRHSDLDVWWSSGDRSILAGLVGALLGVHLGKRLTGYRQPTGDLFAPAVALAMSIGRIGCLLTELPGTPTGGAWGITLTPAQAALLGGPAGVGLHPSFAYEILFQATAFALMRRYRDRLPRSGDLFVCYAAAYALFRFGVEFVRGNEVLWLGMSRPQWFLLAVLPLILFRVARVIDRGLISKKQKESMA